MSFVRTSIGIQVIAFAAVVSWCGIQTYGLWHQDSRRSLVMICCSVFFLGLWGSALALRWYGLQRSPKTTTHEQWNVACMLGLLLSALGVCFAAPMLFSFAVPTTVPAPRTVIISTWIAVGFLGTATLSSVVGLSHPVVQRGKRMGLIAFGVAGIVMFGLVLRYFGLV